MPYYALLIDEEQPTIGNGFAIEINLIIFGVIYILAGQNIEVLRYGF